MKSYRVEIKPTAENDLGNRYLQITDDSPDNALRWYLRTIEAIEKLETFPERCPLAPENNELQLDIRHLIIGDYRALYRINGDVVEVLHIRHQSRARKL